MNLTKEQLRQEYYAQLHREKDIAQACKEWVEQYAGLILGPHFYAPIPTGYEIMRAKESLQAILEKLKK